MTSLYMIFCFMTKRALLLSRGPAVKGEAEILGRNDWPPALSWF